MNSPCILALDTSTRLTSVGLRLPDGSICKEERITEASHDQELFPMARQCLQRAKLALNQLNYIVVGSGPGSFTGLRIGFSFAQGLCLGLRIPLLQSSTLRAWAAPHMQNNFVVVLLDARRGEYFTAAWDNHTEAWAPCILGSQELWQRVEKERQHKNCIVVSDVQLSGISYNVVPPSGIAQEHIAWALGHAEATKPSFDLPHISCASPSYIRSVSAKTIAERSNLGC